MKVGTPRRTASQVDIGIALGSLLKATESLEEANRHHRDEHVQIITRLSALEQQLLPKHIARFGARGGAVAALAGALLWGMTKAAFGW